MVVVLMLTPDIGRDLSVQLVSIYEEAERNMLIKVKNRIDRGITDDGWTELKSNEMTKVRKDLQNTVDKLSKMTNKELEKAIKDAYSAGISSAEVDLSLPLLVDSKIIPFSVQRMILEANKIAEQTNFTILRKTDDALRTIQAEVSTGVLTGVETRKQVAQKMLNRLADAGITSFVDKLGRQWEMSSYVDMVTRAVTANAMLQGHIDRQAQADRDLVVISEHIGECTLCRPFEGKVLSISGQTIGYQTLSSARSQGLFHPNCRHTLTGYIPGLTKIEPPDNSNSEEQYKYTQQQRSNERQIRRWKRREAVAMNDKEKAFAKSKINEYRSRQRELLTEYEDKFGVSLNRRRDSERIRTGKTGEDRSVRWTEKTSN